MVIRKYRKRPQKPRMKTWGAPQKETKVGPVNSRHSKSVKPLEECKSEWTSLPIVRSDPCVESDTSVSWTCPHSPPQTPTEELLSTHSTKRERGEGEQRRQYKGYKNKRSRNIWRRHKVGNYFSVRENKKDREEQQEVGTSEKGRAREGKKKGFIGRWILAKPQLISPANAWQTNSYCVILACNPLSQIMIQHIDLMCNKRPGEGMRKRTKNKRKENRRCVLRGGTMGGTHRVLLVRVASLTGNLLII